MKIRNLIFTMCILAMHADAQSPSGGVGILVPASEDCTEIDSVMDDNYRKAEEISETIGEVIMEVENPAENSCIPSLENIGSMINGALPRAFTLAGLVTRIRDAACAALDDAAERALEKYQLAVRAPYGMGYIRVGVGERGDQDNTGIEDNGRNVLDPIADEIVNLSRTAGREAAESVTSELPDATGVNRTIRDETNNANSDYQNSIDSAREALNGL